MNTKPLSRILLAVALLLIVAMVAACAPEVDVIVHAPDQATAVDIAITFMDAQDHLGGVAGLNFEYEIVSGLEAHQGQPFRLERLSSGDGVIDVWAMSDIIRPDGTFSDGVAGISDDGCRTVIGVLPETVNEMIAAHEMGHAFGLGHVHDNPSNLMYGDSALSGFEVSDEQLSAMSVRAEWIAHCRGM